MNCCKLAGPERFELPTAGFEDQNSSTELRTDWYPRRESNPDEGLISWSPSVESNHILDLI
jgi:hypothetical protein